MRKVALIMLKFSAVFLIILVLVSSQTVGAGEKKEVKPAPSSGKSATSTDIVQITTTDGWVMQGTISSGAVTVETTFGELKIEGRRIRALSRSSFTLDDGSVIRGNIIGGKLQFTSTYGILTIPGTSIDTITGLKQAQVRPKEAPPVTKPPAKPVKTAKPVETEVRFVNKTQNTLQIYIDDSDPIPSLNRRSRFPRC